MEANDPSSSTASTSRSASSSSSSAPSLDSIDAGETCAYLSPSPYNGCRMPRSCQSCLMKSGCMVDELGTCVNTRYEPIDPAKDYTLAFSQGLVLPNATASGDVRSAQQSWQFPAGRVTYCGMGDSVCAVCTRRNFWRSRSTAPDSRFCVGEDGACVCIDACERRWYATQDCSSRLGGGGVYGPSRSQTPTPAPSVTGGTVRSSFRMDDPSIVNRVWQAMVASIGFVLVVLMVVVWSRRKAELRTRIEQQERRRRQQERRARREGRSAQLGVSALSLSGWGAYRRDLIDKETAQLSGVPESHVEQHSERGRVVDDSDSDDDDVGAYVRLSEAADGRDDASNASGSAVPTVVTDAAASEQPSATVGRPTPTPTLARLSGTQTLQPRR